MCRRVDCLWSAARKNTCRDRDFFFWSDMQTTDADSELLEGEPEGEFIGPNEGD